MVYVTPQSEIDKYFESDNMSQSTLKPLLQGLDKFINNQKEEKELYYEEKGSLVIGSAVDCILTGEEGRFDDTYYVSQIDKKPSDAEMSIINMIFDDMTTHYPQGPYKTLDQYPGLIENSVVHHQWYGGKPGEKRIAGLIERGTEYFEDLKLAVGKQVLDSQQIFIISSICESLRTNPITKSYFDREVYNKYPEIDVYYQLPIYFEYKGIASKALLDMLFVFKSIDTGEVISVLPVDLKTMAGLTINFGTTSFKSFRYDIQAAWYTEALRSQSSTITNIVGDNSNLEIQNFKFVVESSLVQGTPLVYEVSDEVLHIGKYGRPAVNSVDLGILFQREEIYQPISLVREVRGFDSLIDEYLYYQENGWEKDRRIPDNGVLRLGWEGIIEQYAD